MDNSTAVWISRAAAIGGGLLSGVYQHWRDNCERPILQIDYQGKVDANLVEAEVMERDGATLVPRSYKWIRASVRNIGVRAAKNC